MILRLCSGTRLPDLHLREARRFARERAAGERTGAAGNEELEYHAQARFVLLLDTNRRIQDYYLSALGHNLIYLSEEARQLPSRRNSRLRVFSWR